MTEELKQEQNQKEDQNEEQVTVAEAEVEENNEQEATEETADNKPDQEEPEEAKEEKEKNEEEAEVEVEAEKGEVESEEASVTTFTGDLEDDDVYTYDQLQAASEDYTDDEFHQLAEMYEDTLNEIEEKEIVTGRVVSVDEKYVIVDIGFKSEGIVQTNEFPDDVVEKLEPGDEVDS